MAKHRSEDLKIAAVEYYLKNSSRTYSETCKNFSCSCRSLERWIEKYQDKGSITRYNRKPISYKITQKQVDYAIKMLKGNEQITMEELAKLIKKKYRSFNITPQHLGKVLRDNNKTRKRTRHVHFPDKRYGVPIVKKKELTTFYNQVKKFPLNKIICLDETSIKPAMIAEYSRCHLGKRCIVKTKDSFFFRKFTLLVAICNSKCIGWILYEKGGMKKERFVEFMKKYIFGKYKDHLIILDNAGSHRNNLVRNAITDSGNKFLFSVPYTPKTNGAVEAFFNQIKQYLKLNKKVLRFPALKKEVEKAIKKVSKDNYKNYFLYAYRKYKLTLPKGKSTRQRKPKKYKK
jgi:transposase